MILQNCSRQQTGDCFLFSAGGSQWEGGELPAFLVAEMLLPLGLVHSQREISADFNRLCIQSAINKLLGFLIHHMSLNNQITTNKAQKLY